MRRHEMILATEKEEERDTRLYSSIFERVQPKYYIYNVNTAGETDRDDRAFAKRVVLSRQVRLIFSHFGKKEKIGQRLPSVVAE